MDEIYADIGLHVGSTHVYVARKIGIQSPEIVVQPAVMAAIRPEEQNSTANTHPTFRYGGNTLLVGESAREKQKTGLVRDLEPCGIEQIHKSEAEFALYSLLEMLIGPSPIPAMTCVHTQPSPPIDDHRQHLFYSNILQDLLKRLGYLPFPVTESRATLSTELADNDKHVLVFSWGDTTLSGCLSFRGMVADEFSLSYGWNNVDDEVSAALDVDFETARSLRHQMSSMLIPKSREQETVIFFCEKSIKASLEKIGNHIQKKGTPFIDVSATVVWSGSWVVPDDFPQFFSKVAKKQKFPIEMGKVRLADDPQTVPARGCLNIASMINRERLSEQVLAVR